MLIKKSSENITLLKKFSSTFVQTCQDLIETNNSPLLFFELRYLINNEYKKMCANPESNVTYLDKLLELRDQLDKIREILTRDYPELQTLNQFLKQKEKTLQIVIH